VLERTERLELRRFRMVDAESLAGYRSDPNVARYQSWEPPLSVAGARELIEEWAEGDPAAPGWFQYAVALRTGGGLIGDIGVHRHENQRQAEIGFTLAAAYQGHGYAAEAVRCLLDRLFRDGMHRVSAECDARNTASARLLDRLGFRREGLRLQHTLVNGEWTDDLLFGLLAADWPGSEPRV
jgi:RimJ/RimL family protein N-acetyltransferase